MPGLLDTFKQKATAVKDYLYPPAPNGMSLWEYAQLRANDPLQPNLSSRITQQDLINKGLNLAGLAPVGMVGRAKTKYEIAHDIASKNAEKMLGLPKGNTAADRAKALKVQKGFHGTADDFPAFESEAWISENQKLANQYALEKGKRSGNNGSNVVPVMFRKGENLNIDVDANSKMTWDEFRKLTETPFENANPYADEIVDGFPQKEQVWSMLKDQNFKNALREKGINSVSIKEGGVPTYLLLNPSFVRSRFAAFDPARVNESDLLAGLAPYLGVGGLLGLGMYGNQDRMTD